MKGCKGDPGGMNEQELQKLESKISFLLVFMQQPIFDNYISNVIMRNVESNTGTSFDLPSQTLF